MQEAKDQEREPEPQPGGEAPEPQTGKPYAEQVKDQDKTKDKPDSGQNEDG